MSDPETVSLSDHMDLGEMLSAQVERNDDLTTELARTEYENDRLKSELERARRARVTTDTKPNGEDKGETADDMPAITSGDCSRWVGKEPPTLPFVVADLIPQNMFTLLVAEGGAGKSLMQQLAGTCIPCGLPFLGMDTMGGNTAGLFAEDGDDVLHVRQARINAALGVDMEALSGRSFPTSYLGHDALLWEPNARGLCGPTAFLTSLEYQLSEIKELRLLTLDNAALLYGGPESDRREVSRFANYLNGMAARLQCGGLISTHTSKSSDGSVSKSASGSTAWVNGFRSVLLLDGGDETKDEPPSLKLLKANHTKPGRIILLEWQDGVLMPAAQPDSLEARIRTRRLDSLIFETVHDGWNRRSPPSSEPQSRVRYLPALINRTSEFSTTEAYKAMVTWIDSGHLQAGQQHTTKTPKGLKIVRWPEHIRSDAA